MEHKTFKGGIHPEYNKELTQDKKIERVNIPSKVIIPLSQHIGIPCKPLVQVGDFVKKGQKIGEAEGFITAPVHSSISGEVVEIAPKLIPIGREVLSCVIKSDEQDLWIDNVKSRSGYLKLSPNEIIAIIKEAGIVGQGGAAFPMHVKLSPPKDKSAEILIVNGAECEPYLTCDHRLMLEYAEEIIKGIEIIMYVTGIKKVYFGIESNKSDAIKTIKTAGRNTLGFEVFSLKTKYPQGSEKHLIKALTGREVPSGGLPLDAGVQVNNVGTMYAVYKAVLLGQPLIERIITVTGRGIANPRNLLVTVGTLVEDIVEYCGGKKTENGKVILGGPMMGFCQFTTQIPVLKGTSGILVLPDIETGITKVEDCIRCGHCVDACPMNLSPYAIADRAEAEYFDDIQEFTPMVCIECGCCSYVCPSKRHMVQNIKLVKQKILNNRKK